MKILKYLLSLLGLALIALVVFVLTQDSHFKVEKKIIVPQNKEIVFNYLNDLKNWQDFFDFAAQASSLDFSYSNQTVGEDATLSWNSTTNSGSIKTKTVFKQDSIYYNINYRGTQADNKVTLKRVKNGTLLLWNSNGNLDLLTKIKAFFYGGNDRVIKNQLDKTLSNFVKTLLYELNTYQFESNDKKLLKGMRYIYQKDTTTFAQLQSKINSILPTIYQFSKKYNLNNGKAPMIIYHTIDKELDKIIFSVAIPTSSEFYTFEDSQIQLDSFADFEAYKTSYTGDYSHRNKAWQATKKVINDKKIAASLQQNWIELLANNATKERKPSRWKTYIYVPIQKKEVKQRIIRETPAPSAIIEEATPAEIAPTN